MSKSAITIEKNFNLNKIKLDLHRELNQAAQIIRKDHYQRLEKGQGVDGSQMKSLKSSTIKRKGNDKILVDTGKMRNLIIEKATPTNQIVEIHPERKQKYKDSGVTMSDVGEFHQKGAGNLPKREWFGISKKAEHFSLILIELILVMDLKNA